MPKGKVESTVRKRTGAWGVDPGYEDAFGRWHEASPQTIQAVLEAMGVEPTASPSEQRESVIVALQGEKRKLRGPATIRFESGECVEAARALPPDLPTGYHQLQFEDAQDPVRLIISPGKCFLPRDLKTWGWSVQLYAARSRASWGIGDLSDLEQLAKWSARELKAGMLLVNPLSAATPILPQQPSPYSPNSRQFFNPLWIHVESVPGAQDAAQDFEAVARAGKDLNASRLIDRDKIFQLKMSALGLIWDRFGGHSAFDSFCEEQGVHLEKFATFCVLAEKHQSGWLSWPSEFRHPAGSAVTAFSRSHRKRVDFHKWLQWIIDGQLSRSARHLSLMQDLPIGVDPSGADAWAWQDVFASHAAVGVPPDEFNTRGQNWGLPPFVPHKLRAAGYEPFIQTIRAAFRHAGGLRIDHVMGLFRLFWIPRDLPAKDGTYVRYNADELLAIVALESERARAYVVGEDLGTVEQEAREKLSRHNVLSYRLLWFEKNDPASYPVEALAAITTHDLPTVAGLWTGSDLAKQHELHLTPNEDSTAEIHRRLTRVAELKEGTQIDEVVVRAYRLLSHAPSRILAAALDDAAVVEERPNIPATSGSQNPNWCLALPLPIEDLMETELPHRMASALGR